MGQDFTEQNNKLYARTAKIGDITGSNYIEIDNAGNLIFYGTAKIIDSSAQVDTFYNLAVSNNLTMGAFGDDTGVLITDSNLTALQIYPNLASTGAVLTGGVVAYGLRNRFLVNLAQTNNVSIYGTQGQLRIKANLAAGVHSGLFGYLEQSGTVTLSSSGAFNSACNLAVETAATLTLNSGVNLEGLTISSLINAGGTLNGNISGIHILKSGSSQNWGAGVRIEDSDIGVNITVPADAIAISIDAGTANHAADGSIINLNIDVEGAFSVNAINVNFDFDTTGMGAADVCSILTADMNEVVVGTNNCILYGTHITMTGFATGRADLVGHRVDFDGSKTAGDLEAGFKVVSTMTVNHSGEIHSGLFVDFSGVTFTDGTVYGAYLDVSCTDNSAAYGAYITIGTSTTAGLLITGGNGVSGIDLSGLTATNDILLPTNGNIVNLVELVTMALKGTVAIDIFPFNTVTLTEAASTFAKVDDGGSFEDLATSSSGGGITSNYQLFPDTELENDAAYFGAAAPFGAIYTNVSATVATYGADSITWEYWDGDSWEALTILWDYTDSTANDGLRPFQVDGYTVFSAPTDWAASTIDSQNAYWIRARCNATVDITQIPLLDSEEHFIVTDANAFECPYAGTISTARFNFQTTSTGTNDTKVILHNFTTGASSAIKTITKALKDFIVADFAMTVAAGDNLGFYITAVDTGGAEYADGAVELKITRT